MKDAKSIVDWVSSNQDPAAMKRVEQVLKGDGHEKEDPMPADERYQPQMNIPLDDRTKAALQAIARIASPMKESLHPGHLVKVLHAAGYDMHKGLDIFGNPDGELHKPDGEPPVSLRDSSQPLQKDHMKAIPEDVLSDMKDVLKSKLEKKDDGDLLGGEQYGASTQKSDDDDDGDSDYFDIDDDADEMEKSIHKDMNGACKAAHEAYKSHLQKMGYRKYPDVQPRMKSVSKDIKQVDIDAIAHDDTEEKGMDVHKSLDLSKVDKSLKPALEAIFKANKEQVEKAARLEKELKAERETRREKEFIEKAAGMGIGGKTEDLAKILKGVADADPTLYGKLEALLKGAAEQIKKSSLFAEIGTRSEGALPGQDAWAKIETIASGMVEKSADKISKSDAIDAVLKTAEGRRLYDEYKAARPNQS